MRQVAALSFRSPFRCVVTAKRQSNGAGGALPRFYRQASAPPSSRTSLHVTAVSSVQPLGGVASTSSQAHESILGTHQQQQPLIVHEIIQGAMVHGTSLHSSNGSSTASATANPPTAVLVHGILGCRRNMQSFAKRLVEGFPHWQVMLVDLRCHGESAAISGALPQPHSVASAAEDVTRLLASLRMFPELLIGHSFGGKVVMSIAQQFSSRGARLPRPVKVWVLDALPGEVRSGEMGAQDRPADLITTLQSIRLPVSSRSALISFLEGRGFSAGVATWAASSLVSAPGGGLVWSFDLPGIAQMYKSYESTSLWPLLSAPIGGLQLSFVKAQYSTFRWGGDDEARIRALGHAVHELPNSGHWVHSDNPEGLFNILAPSFATGSELDHHMRHASVGGTAHGSGNSSSSQGSRRGARGNDAFSGNITPLAGGATKQLQGLLY